MKAECVKPVLVLGVGNILMKDDGAGVRVVEALHACADIPEHVELLDGGTLGFDLLPYLKERKKIVVVDALRFDDDPGSVYRLTPDELSAKQRSFSLHDVGIVEVFRVLAMMGERPEIEIIGIVPEDVASMEISLSKPVEHAIPRAVSEIEKILRSYDNYRSEQSHNDIVNQCDIHCASFS